MLREVARGGTFAAAAEALGLAPSAVSQQMATLERELDAVLFERTARGMRLTEAGRVLVNRAEGVFSQLADARRELSELVSGRRGRLRLGSFPVATASFAARVVRRFATTHPGIEVQLIDGTASEGLARLAAGELDVALLHGDEGLRAAADPRLACVGVEDPPAVVLGRDHPLAERAVVRLEDLAGEPLLAPGAMGHAPLAHRASDPVALGALVAEGLGIAVVGRLAAASLPPGLRIRPLGDVPSASVCIARARDAAPWLAAEALVSALAAEAEAEVERLGGSAEVASTV